MMQRGAVYACQKKVDHQIRRRVVKCGLAGRWGGRWEKAGEGAMVVRCVRLD